MQPFFSVGNVDFWNMVAYEHIIKHVELILDLFELGDISDNTIELAFITDLSGYYIPPHTDVQQRKASILLYVPKDDSLKSFGTTMLVPKNPFLISDGEDWDEDGWDKYRTLKTIPFIPNSMFAFKRTDQSFHCVEKITQEDIVRNQILVMIKEPVGK